MPELHHGGLHWILWELSDGTGSVRVNQTVLSKRLRVSRPTMCKTLDALEREGRIRNISGGRGTGPAGGKAGKLFQVVDPTLYATSGIRVSS